LISASASTMGACAVLVDPNFSTSTIWISPAR
jgi:hypothetical protein